MKGKESGEKQATFHLVQRSCLSSNFFSSEIKMKRPFLPSLFFTLILTIIAVLAIISLKPPSLFGCRGNMAWRFLPIEIARKEYARLEAQLKQEKEKLSLLALPPEMEKWIKFYGNPVFNPGPPGSWEEKSVDCFTIGYYFGQYMMWYVGTPESLNCQIGLATSPDGIHWTKHPDNPIIRLGPKGSWDESILICQSVIYDQEEKLFKMWYIGGTPQGVFSIGLATSPDGVHWTKYAGNPVLRVTEPWEGTVMEAFTVLKTKEGYKIWYGGNDLSRDKAAIGYASSPDGITWVKHPDNPIFTPDLPTRWDGYSVSDPDIIYHDGIYHMWYKGWKRKGGNAWIGHAISYDGINWERDEENPVLLTSSLPGGWDNYEVYRPRVVLGQSPEGGPTFTINRMWYSGRNYSLTAQIGIAHQFQSSNQGRRIRGRFPNVTQDEMQLAVEESGSREKIIAYFTPWMGQVKLTVYSAEGKPVRTLVSAYQLPGYYELSWNSTDSRERPLKPGLYFLELAAENYLLSREIIIK